MFIEIDATYTVELSEEELKLVKGYIENQKECYHIITKEGQIILAIMSLIKNGKISLDKKDIKNLNLKDIRWSELEKKEPEEILESLIE